MQNNTVVTPATPATQISMPATEVFQWVVMWVKMAFIPFSPYYPNRFYRAATATNPVGAGILFVLGLINSDVVSVG